MGPGLGYSKFQRLSVSLNTADYSGLPTSTSDPSLAPACSRCLLLGTFRSDFSILSHPRLSWRISPWGKKMAWDKVMLPKLPHKESCSQASLGTKSLGPFMPRL